MSASKKSWLAALSIGLLPWAGSAVAKHYEEALNQTGNQFALRMIPVGWLIATLGGFFLAYLILGSGSQKLPPLILVTASLLGVLSTWRWVVPQIGSLNWLHDMPRSWQEFTILEPIAIHIVLGFSVGWLWKTTR